MGKLPAKLAAKLGERKVHQSLRNLPMATNRIDFSSNDYLGLSQEKTIGNNARKLLINLESFGNGATGSRLLSGNHPLYQELEAFLVKHHQTDAALVFNSGYDANIGFFSSVPQRGDVVLYDELIHASIRDGIKMGNAKSYKFAHNDMEDLKSKLEGLFRAESRSNDSEIYIVTESVFSMDGDSPDLKALVRLCKEFKSHLIVDEAHATGIYGKGRDLVCELGLQDAVFARIITFGKAMGSHGAAILASEDLKSYLVNFARSLIYTTALSPHTIAGILASYGYLTEKGMHSIEKLLDNIQYFKKQMQSQNLQTEFIGSDSAIHCLIVSGNERVKALANHLQDEGFEVKPILSPTVKAGEERLRFCLHAFNTKEEIKNLFKAIRTYT